MDKTKFRPTADEVFHVDPVNHLFGRDPVQSATFGRQAHRGMLAVRVDVRDSLVGRDHRMATFGLRPSLGIVLAAHRMSFAFIPGSALACLNQARTREPRRDNCLGTSRFIYSMPPRCRHNTLILSAFGGMGPRASRPLAMANPIYRHHVLSCWNLKSPRLP